MTAQETSIPTAGEIQVSPAAHAEHVVRESGTSFFWAMRRLPPEKRAAMYAIYAFCREVDDIADDLGGGPDAEVVKRHQLTEWRAEIGRLYAGAPETLTARALQPAIAAYGLREEDFVAVIAGMEMDAGERVRIADMSELTLYCDRVASAVGRLSTRVFGLEPDLGDRLAFAQGQALQLTNILRDIDEDAERDRLYLPADLLAEYSINAVGELRAVLQARQLPQVCAHLAGIAAARFREARELIQSCDKAAVRPAVMMLEVYGRILDKLTATGWAPPRTRVRLSPAAKLWVMLRYGLL